MDPIMKDEQALADADARARTTYDISHDRPWGWKVSAYLWTKSISAGAFFLAAIAIGFGLVRRDWLFESAAPLVSLVFLAATVGLLVFDLKRPERFLRIFLMPQWKSWLVLGGFVLLIYGGLLAAWCGIRLVALEALEMPVIILGGLFAAMSAIYSAFLFKQARGRVFWHSPLTPIHLLVQAIVAGAAMLILVAAIESAISGRRLPGAGWWFLTYELAGALIASAVLIGGELFLPEENVEKTRASRLITRGIFKKLFWGGAIGIGTVVPLLVVMLGAAESWPLAAVSSACALAGVLLWEHIWVQAGQAVPLS
jgi:formate-dependent nitrite reductase membrane component NrfD